MDKLTEPRILFFDIETSPNLGYYFQLYKEGNIVWNKDHWRMLSFAWKWLGSKQTHVLSLPDFSLYKKDKENDFLLIHALWNVFNQADIVVAHNGNAYDVKRANARFIFHGFEPPSPYKQIDTKLVAKRYFHFDSNKLDDLADYLHIGRKLQTGGWKLWMDCMGGDMKAWQTMCKYNQHDVILLEKVYLKMRPYITNHPNIALMKEIKNGCPNCGSHHIIKQGYTMSRVNKYQKWQCKDCGSWHQSPLKGGQIR